jgi:hypothetical protein
MQDTAMTPRETLRHQFDAEDGSFQLLLRCELRWDWAAFQTLTTAMHDVADEVRGQVTIESWIANGFWYADTWIRSWTGHPNFPRPDQPRYDEALTLLSDLAFFLFMGDSPYSDDTLRVHAYGSKAGNCR